METLYRVSSARLLAREAPSSQAATVAELGRRAVVSIGESERGWGKAILPDGRVGWVSMAHLEAIRPLAPGDAVAADASLNLRFGPGTEFGVVRAVPEGTRLTVAGVEGAWARFELEGVRCYGYLGYLS